MSGYKMTEINTDDLKRLQDAASRYHKEREVNGILEADCKLFRAEMEKTRAECDGLRRQLAEAQTREENAVYHSKKLEAHIKDWTAKVDQIEADNAALLATLESTLDNYAPMGGNGRTCEECDGFDSHIEGCRMFHVAQALSKPHPGAPLLAEAEGLRRVEDAARSSVHCFEQGHPLDGTLSSAIKLTGYRLVALDAIRNRENAL